MPLIFFPEASIDTPQRLSDINCTPLKPEEIQQLQKRIRDIDNALRTIQLEKGDCVRAQEQVPDMQMESFLRIRKDGCQRYLSPVLRIPLNVWTKIFKYVPSSDVVTVCRVCRIWRCTALGISSLVWPKNHILYIRPKNSLYNYVTVTFNTVPNEGSNSISGYLMDRQSSPPAKGNRFMMDFRLMSSVMQWKRLCLSLNLVQIIFGQRYARKGLWASLDELVIDRVSNSDGMTSSSLQKSVPVSLQYLLSLRRLTINLGNRINPSIILVDWSRLEYLHIDAERSHTSDYVNIVQSCRRLETLILACHRSVKRQITNPRIVIPHLKSLILIGGDTIAALLSYFKFPELKSLRLSARTMTRQGSSSDRYIYSAEDIMLSVKKSRCRLDELELHCIVLSDFEIIPDLLRSMPDLTQLKVADNGGMPDLLSCLKKGYRDDGRSPHTPPTLLVPKLKRLIVETDVPENWPQADFNALCNLRSTLDVRGSDGSRLKNYCIMERITPFDIDTQLSRFVRELADQGVFIQSPYVSTPKDKRKT